ncbi:organic cation transporter protein-like [Haemaphysalis longicornis]
MEFEDVLEELGGFGKFQKTLLWFFLLPSQFLLPFFSMNLIFLLSEPDHQCVVPELDALGLNASHVEHLRKLVVSEDECSMFPLLPFNTTVPSGGNASDGATWNLSGMVNQSAAKQPCEQFRYDDLYYDETVPTKWDLVCDRGHLPSLVYTVGTVGGILGTLIFGAMADRIGRRRAFFITVAIAVVFGISSVLATSFTAFVVLRFINATMMPQIFQLPYIILLELVGPKQRTAMLGVAWMSWTVGLCLLPLVAYMTRTWVLLGLICACSAALNSLYWKLLPESPRWLLSRNRFSEAVDVLTRIAKTNGVQPPKNLATDLECVQRKLFEEKMVAESSTLDLIRMPRIRNRFLIIVLSWVANSAAYYGMSINVTNMSGNEFLNFFLLGLVEFPACVVSWWAMEKLGRRWMNVFFQCLVSTSCVAFCLAPADSAVTGVVLLMLAKFSCTASAMVVYQQASEVMPTPVRSFALGASSSVASTLTVAIPYIIFLGKYGRWIPFVVIAMLATLGGTFSVWLPETRGFPLSQTMEAAEQFGVNQKFFSFNRVDHKSKPGSKEKGSKEKEMNLLPNACDA